MRPVPNVSSTLLRLLHLAWSGGKMTPAEQQELQQWLDASPQHREVYNEILSERWPAREWELWNDISVADNWAKVQAHISAAPLPSRRRILYRWAAAAAVLLLITTGIYYWYGHQPVTHPPLTAIPDIAPGKEGAILTLGDGRQVVLDSAGNGVIAIQQGSTASLKNGALVYEHGGEKGVVVYNSMHTPKGRQFQLTLPDGTKVWLNAASSIRYPTAFDGKERNVEVSGEAYFEVAQNAAQPFRVNVSQRASIEVLGTHFNINAYNEDDMWRATLLEGKIRVREGEQAVTIQPGQQAQIARSISIRSDVDVDQVMAWKNGYFNFDGMKLREAMRQIERWYDISVIYEGRVPDIDFVGELPRNTSLAELTRSLADVGVHFRIEAGRRLIVTP